MKIESTHLLTLSAFVDQQKEYSTFSARTAEEIISYNDFLKQELNVYMFDTSSDNAIFKGFEIASFSSGWMVFKDNIETGLLFRYNRNGYYCNNIKTLSDLAEATKDDPLRFRKQPYFDNEELS